MLETSCNSMHGLVIHWITLDLWTKDENLQEERCMSQSIFYFPITNFILFLYHILPKLKVKQGGWPVLAVVLSDAALEIRHKVNTKQQEHLTSFANSQNMSKNFNCHIVIFQNIIYIDCFQKRFYTI